MSGAVVDVLTKARELLTPEGAWGQGSYTPAPGCYCILGALCQAGTGDADFDRLPTGHGRPWDSVWGALNLVRPAARRFGSVSVWNDAPDRTQAEVLAALDAAIAAAGAP